MIDLSSDTQTRPTPAMREFMAAAPVGDEQLARGPFGQSAPGDSRRAARQGRGSLPSLGHDVQRHRLQSQRRTVARR